MNCPIKHELFEMAININKLIFNIFFQLKTLLHLCDQQNQFNLKDFVECLPMNKRHLKLAVLHYTHSHFKKLIFGGTPSKKHLPYITV